MLNNNYKVTYVLVSDGSKARIYASDVNKHNLRLINTLSSETARIHSYDLGSKKPHGIFERNRPEAKVDLHAKAKKVFARHIASLLNNGVIAHEFQKLVLIAPPKFLGSLRSMLTKGAIDLVIKEIKKDLTGSDEQNLKNYIWE